MTWSGPWVRELDEMRRRNELRMPVENGSGPLVTDWAEAVFGTFATGMRQHALHVRRAGWAFQEFALAYDAEMAERRAQAFESASWLGRQRILLRYGWEQFRHVA